MREDTIVDLTLPAFSDHCVFFIRDVLHELHGGVARIHIAWIPSTVAEAYTCSRVRA